MGLAWWPRKVVAADGGSLRRKRKMEINIPRKFSACFSLIRKHASGIDGTFSITSIQPTNHRRLNFTNVERRRRR